MTDYAPATEPRTLRDMRFDEIRHIADLRLAAAHRFGDLLTVMHLALQILEDGDAEYAARVMKHGLKKYDTPDVTIAAAAEAGSARGPRVEQHGTYATYCQGCRCDECREANRKRGAADRESRSAREIPSSVQHGKAATYSNWSCRCEPCRAAHSEAYQARRDANKP
jgi:hypothetical protein